MSTVRTGPQTLAAAKDLTPLIGAVREQIEQTRCLPPHLVSAMQDADIFRMWLPRARGGPELSIAEFVRVVEALSYVDGSVGWCAGINAAYTRFAGFLSVTSASQIFDGHILAGSLLPSGRGVKVDGGYRVTGRWAWASGIMHSDWIIVAFLTHLDDRPLLANGVPEVRIAFFPKLANVEVIDTWHVSGMRGTGSHDIAVTDVFVPEHHTLGGPEVPPQHPGSLYALPVHSVFPFVIAAAPLGIAMAAFDTFLNLARVKAPISGSVLLRDKPTVQAMVGRAQALLQSAREFYYMTACDASTWGTTGEPLTDDQRARIRLAVAQIAEVTKEVVRNLYDAAGGSSVYATCPLERHFRDIYTAAQHFQVSPNNFEFAGRVILGLDPGTPRF